MFLSAAMLLWSSVTMRGAIDPMAVAAPAGGDSALYFVLRNSGEREDRLLGVTCTCAARVEIATTGGRGSAQARWPMAMPPLRLLELIPGGSRHLVLRRLTRALVAGQRVTITLQYSDGSDEQDVRIVDDAEAGWAADSPQRRSRMAPLDVLAGWCWRGTSRDGRRTDTRCFSPSYGWDLQERDVVQEEGAPATTDYRLYAHDRMAVRINFDFLGTDGRRQFGTVIPIEDGVSFVDYDRTGYGTYAEGIVTSWTRDGADVWRVVAESRRPGARRELWRLRMVRAGPAPPL